MAQALCVAPPLPVAPLALGTGEAVSAREGVEGAEKDGLAQAVGLVVPPSGGLAVSEGVPPAPSEGEAVSVVEEEPEDDAAGEGETVTDQLRLGAPLAEGQELAETLKLPPPPPGLGVAAEESVALALPSALRLGGTVGTSVIRLLLEAKGEEEGEPAGEGV